MFTKPVPSINIKDLPKDCLLIDVREEDEFEENHLDHAINIPMNKLSNFKSDQDVYVICASGIRSLHAVQYLRANKVNAINVRGGMLYV